MPWVRVRLAGFVLVLACLGACANRAPRETLPRATPRLHAGPLTDLVPSAGLRWLVVARPKWLYEQPRVRASLGQLFPDARLDAFERNAGVDLRALESGVIAGFDLGTLYLAQAPTHVGIAHQAFLDRLLSAPLTKRLGDGVTHTTGMIGVTPESFVALDGIGFALSVGDPTLTKITGAYALGKLAKSPSALHGAALGTLPESLHTYPLRFYAPGPFAGEWRGGARGLLKDTLAVAIVAHPEPSGVLRVVITTTGDYGDDLARTNQRARQCLTDLAESELGRLLGLGADAVTTEVIVERQGLTLNVELPLKRLADGLYTAVAANVWELLELSQPPPKREAL